MSNDKPNLFAVFTETLYCLVILLTLAAVSAGIFWASAPTLAEQYWYAFTNHVPRARVFVSPRPTDCLLDRANSGAKRCHYERVVEVGNDTSGNKQVTVHWQKVSE
jgi:hypothetical protein